MAYGIAFASHEEIDQINILQATFLAMERAMAQLDIKPDLALIDGNRQKDFGINVETVVKGDSRSANIAAASVLAKVTRDDYMEAMALEYPGYGFEVPLHWVSVILRNGRSFPFLSGRSLWVLR